MEINVSAKSVETKSDIKKFLDFSWETPYDSYDVPILDSVIKAMLNGKHPSCKYGEINAWLFLKDNKVVGRTTLHSNILFNKKLGSKVILFGCTILNDDIEVFKAFFNLIEEQALVSGASKIFGPASLLPNQQGGASVSNFDIPGFVDSAYTPEFFVKALDDWGFLHENDSQTCICDGIQDDGFDPESLFNFDDTNFVSENLAIRYGDKKEFDEQRKVLLPLINKSFSTLPYFTNIDEQEFAFQTDGLEYLIDESLLLFLEKDGVPVAFVLVVPDISDFIIKCSGNLNMFNQLKLYFSRKKYRKSAILIIKGTDPDFAGSGFQTLLHRELFKNLKAGGYETLFSTFVELTNPGSSASYLRAGGRPLQDFAFFSKELETKKIANTKEIADTIETTNNEAVVSK